VSGHRPGDSLPDGRKASDERGFGLLNPIVERLVGRCQQDGGLVDAKQRIGVDDEGDEELVSSEFRIVEWDPVGVGGFPVTASTPDVVGLIEGVERVLTTVQTGMGSSDRLEAPLKAIVKRPQVEINFTPLYEIL